MKERDDQMSSELNKFLCSTTLSQIIDLTHFLDKNIPNWDGGCGFHLENQLDYSECSTEVKFRVNEIKMDAGIGTHIDAPAHCIPNSLTIDQLPLSRLLVPCVVIDVSERAHERYRVSPLDIKRFENKYGVLSPGRFVMIRTGWDRFWNEPKKYHNNHIFPSISREAAELLLDREIVGIGIDTLSPDIPESGYPVHRALLGSEKYIIENVANLHMLPACGSFILALPMKIKDSTEAPVRIIGLI